MAFNSIGSPASANSQAGLELSLRSAAFKGGKIHLQIEATNPVDAPRDGTLLRVRCVFPGGREITPQFIATARQGLEAAKQVGKQVPVAQTIEIEHGFPGGKTVLLTFRIKNPAGQQQGVCSTPELRGVW